eukprot:1159418-Pelagomonas_calceolata.AAC.4
MVQCRFVRAFRKILMPGTPDDRSLAMSAAAAAAVAANVGHCVLAMSAAAAAAVAANVGHSACVLLAMLVAAAAAAVASVGLCALCMQLWKWGEHHEQYGYCIIFMHRQIGKPGDKAN